MLSKRLEKLEAKKIYDESITVLIQVIERNCDGQIVVIDECHLN